jgi:hypothetical protein
MLITKKEALEDLKDYEKRHDIRFELDSNNNVRLYHGTSKQAAINIESSGYFHDGFFFSSREALETQSGNYAEIRSKQKGEEDGGVVMEFIVDPRCILVNGAGETESTGDLFLDKDDVWKTKEYLNENLPETQPQDRGYFESELIERMYHKPNQKVLNWLWQTFQYYTYSEKMDINSVIQKMISDFKYFESLSHDYYIDEMLSDDEYDDEEELRELEESFFDGFKYKEMLQDFGIAREEFDNLLEELSDEDIFNKSLFVKSFKENKVMLFEQWSQNSEDGNETQIAYHGSPHNFDYFSMSMFGQGEGASGFGYGMYFSEDYDDAEDYARKLEREEGEGCIYTCEVPSDDYLLDFQLDFEEQSDYVKYQLNSIPNKDKIKIIQDYFDFEEFKQNLDDEIDEYDFEIGDDEYNEFLQDILDTEFSNVGHGRDLFDYMKQFLPEYSHMNGEAYASEYLMELGIKGIKHSDFSIVNYVIFSDEDIEIIDKKIYGE